MAVRAGAARVHDPFRNPLVVEMGDLLAQMEVLHQGRAGMRRLSGIPCLSPG
jgi:hypothetical protein